MSSPFGTQASSPTSGFGMLSPFGTQASAPTSGFGAFSSSAFGRSTPGFGTSLSPAFGTDSSPIGPTSGFGAAFAGPAFGTAYSPIGPTSGFSPAFGGPTFGTASSPIGPTSGFGAAFGGPAFGTASTSPFGGSSVSEQNPASERSGFTAPSSPFGNPTKESQPTMGGSPPPEASITPTFGEPAIQITGSPVSEQNLASECSLSSLFGSPSQESQPTMEGAPPLEASSEPAFGAPSTPASASSITPAFCEPAIQVTGSSVSEQNPASECSEFTTPPAPFGNPSQESQLTMGVFGMLQLEASSEPTFGAHSTPASASSVTPASGEPAIQITGSSVSEQNPASECSGFTTPSSPFGNPSQDSQPTMGVSGTSLLEALSELAIGAPSTPTSASSVTPASSIPASGSNSTPAFGSTGSANCVSNSPFGSTTPAFGTPSTPAYCSTPSSGSSFSFASPPAFDHSPTPFGVTSIPVSPFGPSDARARSVTPAFGDHGFSLFNQPSSAQSSPLGAHPTMPAFGDHGFSLFSQSPVGSRVYSYAQTPEADNGCGTLPAGKLESISAMPGYKGKTHEELRWEDYRIGDKGDLKPFSSTTTNPFAQKTTFCTPGFAFPPAQSQTPSGIFPRPGYYATPSQSPFDKPNTSNPFGPAQAQTPSVFCTASSFPPGSSLFGTPASNPFGTPTSPSPFGTPHTSNPFVPSQAQAPAVFYRTPSNPFGTPTSRSPFGTPNTSNPFWPAQAQAPSVFYTTPSNPFGTPTSPSFFATPNTSGFGTPSIFATTQAQGTTSLFANGINPGTQSANLFQSSSPSPGQTSSPFWQPPFVQAAPYHVYAAQTGGIGGFNQNNFEQMFSNLNRALQAMRQMSATVAVVPAPMRLSCVSSNDISFMMLELQNLRL